MLPDKKRQLIRLGTAPGPTPDQKVSLYLYVSNDATATVVTAGHFNFARDVVRKGDVVIACTDHDGNPDVVFVRFTAVPAAPTDVTVSQADAASVIGDQPAVTSLTDNSGGAAGDVIAAIGAAYDQAEVANAIASLAAKINAVIGSLETAGLLTPAA